MQHTTNYSLPQWEATDTIKRADVNSAMSGIDTALAGLGAVAVGKAHVESRGYYGTGTYGEDNDMSFTFSGTPKLIFITGDYQFTIGGSRRTFTTIIDQTDNTVKTYYFNSIIEGNTFRFHSNTCAAYQANESGKYYVINALVE